MLPELTAAEIENGNLVLEPLSRVGRSEPSADLLRQFDDDPLRAADVAEPVAVLVALDLADELRAADSQASDGGVDVVDCECEMAEARGVRGRVRVAVRAGRREKLHQLEPSVAVRGLQHRGLHLDALQPDYAVHPTALEQYLAKYGTMGSVSAEARPLTVRACGYIRG
jgi:hypothetical protein